MYEKEITEKLTEMHMSGSSYAEIGKQMNLAPSTVAGIVNGRQPAKNPTIDLLCKVFPRARIELEPSMPSASGMQSVPDAAADPLLRELLDHWPDLTRGEQSRVVCEVIELLEKKGSDLDTGVLARHKVAQ